MDDFIDNPIIRRKKTNKNLLFNILNMIKSYNYSEKSDVKYLLNVKIFYS